jgi:hypothetical protein
MRVIFLIISLCLLYPGFGQDSLQADTFLITSSSTLQDSVHSDSASTSVKGFQPKKKKQGKKLKKTAVKEKPVSTKPQERKEVNTGEKGHALAGLLVVIVFGIVIFALLRLIFSSSGQSASTTQEGDFLSDYLNRTFLSRRDYYRNVYLKSEEWQRKRYVVLKRDNWQCVYCGGPATEVHHTRYAKRNIGKEPIDWLVSICRACHDLRHQ